MAQGRILAFLKLRQFRENHVFEMPNAHMSVFSVSDLTPFEEFFLEDTVYMNLEEGGQRAS